MTGSKVKIWKQDPSVRSAGIRTAYVSTEVDHGPQDADIASEFTNPGGSSTFPLTAEKQPGACPTVPT